jgi:hypothetical protein
MAIKTAKPKAPNKTEKLAAYSAGCAAREQGQTINPHSPDEAPILHSEWARGWGEADNTIKAMSEPETPAEAPTETPSTGHDFADPDVVASQVNLADLMDAFDAVGVLIEETQWRAFSDEERAVGERWCSSRKNGVLSPVPSFLQPFATKTLLDEIAPYNEMQESGRKTAFPCVFEKPSALKKTDDGQMLKIGVKVSQAYLSDSEVGRICKRKHCRVEFSLRKFDEWNQPDLPGVETDRRIIVTKSNITGFKWASGCWSFTFLVDTKNLTIGDANDMWMLSGSCQIEVLGEAVKGKHDEDENPENEEDENGDEPAEVRQPNLFDADRPGTHRVDLNGVFEDPNDYLVPIKNGAATCIINVGIGSDGSDERHYVASDLIVEQPGDEEPLQIGDEWPVQDPAQGYVSLQAAMESEVGWLIDECITANVPMPIVDELRDYLKYISTGGKPQRVPRSTDEQVDPSY